MLMKYNGFDGLKSYVVDQEGSTLTNKNDHHVHILRRCRMKT